jgi:hypothetical protein
MESFFLGMWRKRGGGAFFYFTKSSKPGLGNLNMLVSNDLFKHEKIGLGM